MSGLTKKIMCSLFILAGGIFGYELIPGTKVLNNLSIFSDHKWLIPVISFIIGSFFGFILFILSYKKLNFFGKRIITYFQKIPAQNILSGVIGLIVGLIIANLLAYSLSFIPFIGNYLPIILNVTLGLLGITLGLSKRAESVNFYKKNIERFKKREKSSHSQLKILDTSVIIDGRIADISQTDFLEGILIIPRFVLNELQAIADSSEPLKRNRGRRGLDVLNKINKVHTNKIKIISRDYTELKTVDTKLIKLAKELDAKILTNDYNLNKLAQLENVTVLNINDLANALKSIILPGEELVTQIIKEGKESGQGVAYLDDGTMIVVENGMSNIGEKVKLTVTSILQTPAGRMIFGRIKERLNKKNQDITFQKKAQSNYKK
ncbi:MAG: PIN domain nuclease [Atribacterota bacterium]|nr:PIN domain nuclease [Atribacterota bacterium]MDY0382580.1 PIN domain nuclease [Atribacterota bacterium]